MSKKKVEYKLTEIGGDRYPSLEADKAVGHNPLTTGNYYLARKMIFQDLGGNCFDRRDREAAEP